MKESWKSCASNMFYLRVIYEISFNALFLNVNRYLLFKTHTLYYVKKVLLVLKLDVYVSI